MNEADAQIIREQLKHLGSFRGGAAEAALDRLENRLDGVRVVVCGSRDWTDERIIASVLRRLPQTTTVVHGAARGADRIAGVVAASLGMDVEEWPANWATNPRRAGLDRNLAMLDSGPSRVIAFWDGHSTGTKHTIDNALRRGIPVIIYPMKG